MSNQMTLAPNVAKMLEGEPDAPLQTISDGPFKGVRVEPMPDSFESDRKFFRYVASDEDPRGDMIIVPDVGAFCLAPRALDAFTKMTGLKKPDWFVKTFDAPTRTEMATQALAAVGSRKTRCFFRDTADGPTILSLLDSRRPVLADVEVLQAASEVFGSSLKTKLARRADGGMNLQLLAGDTVDLMAGREKSDMEVGDRVEFGVQIRNSQLGFFSPYLDGFMERLTCKNGATTDKRMDAWSTYDRDKSLTHADLREWFTRGLHEVAAQLDVNIDKCKLAMDTDAGPDLLAAACADNGMPAKMMAMVYKAFMKEPGTKLWNVANAFTLAAHTNDLSLPEQLKLERVGGGLIFA